jgi:hypothetical protein
MKRRQNAVRIEMNAARRRWGPLVREKMKELQTLVEAHKLSISQGDVLLLDNRWYVTHSGLLRCARRHRCSGIKTTLEPRFSDPVANRWVFRAVVYGSNKLKAFVGYGDADPSNVSSLIHGAEMRIAETRAVNRALRKAYGIGLCSVEELGAFSSVPKPSVNSSSSNGSGSHPSNGSCHGKPRLRDQLCLLIRQFNLDANLVKSYAADFCGTDVLGEASRESVQSFISHLAAAAKDDRDALICKLNSYAQPVEARS